MKEIEEKIAILIATYNGEKFLEEQIESILSQTYKNFVIYIRDDNSTDQTQKIIQKYLKKYPTKIFQVEDNKTAKGACKNFMYLLEYVYKLDRHDMFMFCDQDDFWLNNKIEDTVIEYEKVENKNKPVLIHTDLQVVDKDLKLINKSFLKYSNLNWKCHKFNNYLVQNNVTGCTTFLNKSLVDLIKFDIQNIRMHDWYLALLASAFGKVIFIDKATIKYRQHGGNVLGAKKVSSMDSIFKKIIENYKYRTIRKDFSILIDQAKSFKEAHYEQLDEKNKKNIDDFCNLLNYKKIKRIRVIIKNRFYKHGIIRKIGQIIFC